MEPPIQGEERAGLDRRTVIRRGAILGGALVWTAPAVQTIAGPAFAAGSPVPCNLPPAIIFIDRNGNGTQDANEPCIAKITFSDGNGAGSCCACYVQGGSSDAALIGCSLSGACTATPGACN